MEQINQQVLSIPHFLQQTRQSTDHEDSEGENENTETSQGEDGIGEYDDGKSGKLTLTILLAEDLIQPGDGVLSIDYLGQSFKGDLLPVGKIRSVETGLVFNNPSAWAIYCKKIINPAKKSGCGWASIKYKGRKMDYFKTIWMKRKAQREAENAKNEAAHALTALSNSLANPSPPPPSLQQQQQRLMQQQLHHIPEPAPSSVVVVDREVDPPVLSDPSAKPVIKHTQIPHAMSHPRDYYVELESFLMDGRLQPFTVSVSTSAILVLDLHAHMSLEEDVCGYLAGHWDVNSHNLAITHTFPCLVDKTMLGTEEARRVESEIYDKLYGNHLSLLGWYHSSPKGPSIPTVKDCFDQLDFQIKLLGNGMETYTPCVGLLCSPYEQAAKAMESSIVVYWIYPPSESNCLDYGRPMRMSYSAITDPCLSTEVLDQIDKITGFYKDKPSTVPFLSEVSPGLRYLDKLYKSIAHKFPQDQDDQLWLYIRTQLIGDEPHEEKPGKVNGSREINGQMINGQLMNNQLISSQLINNHTVNNQITNGRNASEEEEIDDDEENALQEEEEIDDDEENAIAESQARNYVNNTGRNYSPLSFNQVISTSPPRVGNNGELDLRISGNSTAQTITMYSHQDLEQGKQHRPSQQTSPAGQSRDQEQMNSGERTEDTAQDLSKVPGLSPALSGLVSLAQPLGLRPPASPAASLPISVPSVSFSFREAPSSQAGLYGSKGEHYGSPVGQHGSNSVHHGSLLTIPFSSYSGILTNPYSVPQSSLPGLSTHTSLLSVPFSGIAQGTSSTFSGIAHGANSSRDSAEHKGSGPLNFSKKTPDQLSQSREEVQDSDVEDDDRLVIKE